MLYYRGVETFLGFRDRLVGQRKGSPVNSHRPLGLHIFMNLYSRLGVYMVPRHEPFGFIASDGYEGTIEGTKPVADFFKLDVIVSRVACKPGAKIIDDDSPRGS